MDTEVDVEQFHQRPMLRSTLQHDSVFHNEAQ